MAAWSRSRFWLSHFLNNRHQRPGIAWDARPPLPPGLHQPGLGWLAGVAELARRDRRWLIDRAAASLGDDPALVQSLRLMVKEDQFLAQILAAALEAHGWRTAAPQWLDRLSRPLRRFLGLRFEIATLLLTQTPQLALAQVLRQAGPPGTLRQVLDQLLHDRRQHLAFQAEWLTLQFADFNFLRRNLRRWRLRLLFAGILALAVLRHRRLLRAAGWPPLHFAGQCWNSFQLLLESMVPYRRDALLAQLRHQQHEPYAPPASIPFQA